MFTNLPRNINNLSYQADKIRAQAKHLKEKLKMLDALKIAQGEW